MTWATSVPILVFLGLSVLDLGPMYATDRRQTASSLNAPAFRGRGITKEQKTFCFVSGIYTNVRGAILLQVHYISRGGGILVG